MKYREVAKSVGTFHLSMSPSTIDSTAITTASTRIAKGAHGPLLVSELARDGRDGGQDGVELSTLSETPRRPPVPTPPPDAPSLSPPSDFFASSPSPDFTPA